MPYANAEDKKRYDAQRRETHRAEINRRQAKWARDKRAKRGLKPRLSVEERFWAKVEKTDGCWLWKPSGDRNVYGTFGVATKKLVSAHHFSWETANGPVPDGKQVLHSCDDRRCVRPMHLFLGTQLDNIRDMMSKGRQRFVAAEPNARKTQCPKGHAYDAENTITRKGKRYCRACRRGGR